ncbi:MAG: P-II family nitrogen regulator, partial [Deltaproteobacteria bacterium]
MRYRKVTAIVNAERLAEVEQALIKKHVSGISVSQVRGFGEYQDFYKPDLMCRHTRIEIFCRSEEADAIARCIMDAAHTGISGDGIVAILPVEHLYCI